MVRSDLVRAACASRPKRSVGRRGPSHLAVRVVRPYLYLWYCNWFRSCLKTERFPIIRNVPQRSVPGPRGFTVYTEDITVVLEWQRYSLCFVRR